MNIEDIRINQKFVDRDGNIHTAASINDAGVVRDKENGIHFVKEIKPVPGKLYTETEERKTMLCIDTPVGKLMADADEESDAGYSALYLSLLPENAMDSVDIATIRNQGADLQVKVWGNFGALDPTDDFQITESDIKSIESEG